MGDTRKIIKLLQESNLNEVEKGLYEVSMKFLSYNFISAKKIGIMGLRELWRTHCFMGTFARTCGIYKNKYLVASVQFTDAGNPKITISNFKIFEVDSTREALKEYYKLQGSYSPNAICLAKKNEKETIIFEQIITPEEVEILYKKFQPQIPTPNTKIPKD